MKMKTYKRNGQYGSRPVTRTEHILLNLWSIIKHNGATINALILLSIIIIYIISI